MAGGQWTETNKVLPGIYINYKTKPNVQATVGTRGVVAIAKELPWGPTDTLMEINDITKIKSITGYDIASPEMLFVRELTKGTDLTKGASSIFLGRLKEIGGSQAQIKIGDLTVKAKYTGIRGNGISVIVSPVISTKGQRPTEPPYTTLDLSPKTGEHSVTNGTSLSLTVTTDGNTVQAESSKPTIGHIEVADKIIKFTPVLAGETNLTVITKKTNSKDNKAVYKLTVTADATNWKVNIQETTSPQTNTPAGPDEDDYVQWTVQTLVDMTIVDEQIVGIFKGKDDDENVFGRIEDLVTNDWVIFEGEGYFEANAGAYLTGGTNGTVATDAHTDFITKLSKKTFNVVIYDGNDVVMKSIYKAFVDRLCKDEGRYIVGVMANYVSANSEYIISVNNSVTNDEGYKLTPEEMTWWVGGASAGANYNESLTYKQYPGAIAVEPEYENSELGELLTKGNLLFFKLNNKILLLSDVNTFTSFTPEKGKALRKNRVIRTIMQICNDLYIGYSEQYIGKVDVNKSGVGLVKAYGINYLNQIQANSGIKNFDPDNDFTVNEFEIDSMKIAMNIQPVDSLEKLYIQMTIA